MILASALRGLYHVSLLRECSLWLKVISDWTVASYCLTYVVQLNKRMSVLLKEQHSFFTVLLMRPQHSTALYSNKRKITFLHHSKKGACSPRHVGQHTSSETKGERSLQVSKNAAYYMCRLSRSKYSLFSPVCCI